MKQYPIPINYKPIHPEKYVGDISKITLRSSWEQKMAHWCDTNTSVLKWGSEIKAIEYFCNIDKKVHRYFPDFWLTVLDKHNQIRQLIVEIKPNCQINRPKVSENKKRKTLMREVLTWQKNQDKWAAATKWAKDKGWEFVIMDETALGIKKG